MQRVGDAYSSRLFGWRQADRLQCRFDRFAIVGEIKRQHSDSRASGDAVDARGGKINLLHDMFRGKVGHADARRVAVGFLGQASDDDLLDLRSLAGLGRAVW